MTDLEGHHQAISTIQTDLDTIKTGTTEMANQIIRLAAQMDDTEKRSRRYNLIFYNIPDPNPEETFAESEEVVIRHCNDRLEFAVDP